MTRDDIIKLAREADLWLTSPERIAAVERFAALVADAEREACARLCDARYMGDNNREDMEARRCADAIRARWNK
jgi:hypothetical protein